MQELAGGGGGEGGLTRHHPSVAESSPVSLRRVREQKKDASEPVSVSENSRGRRRGDRGRAAQGARIPSKAPPTAGRSLVFSPLYTARGCHAAAAAHQSAAAMTRRGHTYDTAMSKTTFCRGSGRHDNVWSTHSCVERLENVFTLHFFFA